MWVQYQGLSGAVYFVEEKKIAGGGEGSIHKIQSNYKQVAKIFKANNRNPEREEKLRLMVSYKLTDEQYQTLTWPQDVIYDKNGFVGYIMPKLNALDSITSIYNNGDNQYDLRYRVIAAINLCIAVQTVHEMGQVCGDLNPQNICVNLDSTGSEGFHITLVDTDSYHISAKGKTYRCEVGLADYIAPELQKKFGGGRTLKSIPLPTYTKETDLFALAVHIFTLLMNGCHPFACAQDINGSYQHTMGQMNKSFDKPSVVTPQPIDNIKNGFFPFYHKKDGITYPLYSPAFESLPYEIYTLFVRTFTEGYHEPEKRADTQEWIDALIHCMGTGTSNIVSCTKNKSHYFFRHNTCCPLCAMEERMMRYLNASSEVPPPPPKQQNRSEVNTTPPQKHNTVPPPVSPQTPPYVPPNPSQYPPQQNGTGSQILTVLKVILYMLIASGVSYVVSKLCIYFGIL